MVIGSYKCGCSYGPISKRERLAYCSTHGQDIQSEYPLPYTRKPRATKSKDGTDTIQPRSPAQVFHPGEHLRDELLARGISKRAFAKKIGIPERYILRICRETRDITSWDAMRIGRGLGTSAELWINLQRAWDSWVSERRNMKAR